MTEQVAEVWLATARAFVAFLIAFLLTRILNKQYMARLTYFDFTLAVSIGALVGHVTNDYEEPFWAVVAPVLIFGGLGLAISWMALRFMPARAFLEGCPTVLIENGKVLDQNMRRLRYNLDELQSQLRTQGIFDITRVEFAVLEPGGHLSVLPKSQHRPLTPADLQVPTSYEGLAIELVMDGKLVQKSLLSHGLSDAWVTEQLRSRGYDQISDVFLAVLTSRGDLFIDPYKDRHQ